jgi:hypothetical protein
MLAHDLFGKPVSTFPDHAFLAAHDPFGKPASTPDQIRGRLFPDRALERNGLG